MQAVLEVVSTGGYGDRMLSEYIGSRSNVMLRGILCESGFTGYNDRSKLCEDIVVELLSHAEKSIRFSVASAKTLGLLTFGVIPWTGTARSFVT
jgi:hypothetical protein